MDSKTETPKPRFASDVLFSTPEAEFKHFQQIDGIHDRFGNRIFTSKDLAYYDREGDATRAALLVSKEGGEFIKSHPGILNTIDKGLKKAAKTQFTENFTRKNLELGENINMSLLKEGGQSKVYLLQAGDDAFILKTRANIAGLDPSQPYINEMLQIQAITADLGNKLSELRVALPTFLFASGQISCVKFETGKQPWVGVLGESRIEKIKVPLSRLFINYIDAKKDDPLWKNIKIDLTGFSSREIREDNFIQRQDGTLVFIDPVLYFPKGAGNRQILARILHILFPGD